MNRKKDTAKELKMRPWKKTWNGADRAKFKGAAIAIIEKYAPRAPLNTISGLIYDTVLYSFEE